MSRGNCGSSTGALQSSTILAKSKPGCKHEFPMHALSRSGMHLHRLLDHGSHHRQLMNPIYVLVGTMSGWPPATSKDRSCSWTCRTMTTLWICGAWVACLLVGDGQVFKDLAIDLQLLHDIIIFFSRRPEMICGCRDDLSEGALLLWSRQLRPAGEDCQGGNFTTSHTSIFLFCLLIITGMSTPH
jgi:hypothetical protein